MGFNFFDLLKATDSNTILHAGIGIAIKWQVPLTTCEGNELPRIQLNVWETHVFNCFIDTGASRTIIMHKLAKRIYGNNYRRTLDPVNTVLLDAGDWPLPCLGMTRASIAIGPLQVNQQIIVLPGDTETMLWG